MSETQEQAAPSFGARIKAVAAELEYLQKDGFNDHHKYKFVGEAKVKSAVRAALAKHGLALVRAVTTVQPGTTPTAAVVHVQLTISDPLDFRGAVVFEGVGGDQDKSGKAVMKATAAAIKYALTTGFLIATGDDPERGKKADELGEEADAAPKQHRRSARPKLASDDSGW